MDDDRKSPEIIFLNESHYTITYCRANSLMESVSASNFQNISANLINHSTDPLSDKSTNIKIRFADLIKSNNVTLLKQLLTHICSTIGENLDDRYMQFKSMFQDYISDKLTEDISNTFTRFIDLAYNKLDIVMLRNVESLVYNNTKKPTRNIMIPIDRTIHIINEENDSDLTPNS